MNISPTFSIIIPTYNHGHLISKCLQSLLDQTLTSWEAIVVNNFSDDDTISVVHGFADPRIQLINFRNNGIIAASRNEGLRRSSGAYIAFLDSDDWWYPEKLEVVQNAMARADVVHHDCDVYTTRGKQLLKLRGRQLKKPVFVDLMTRGNPVINSSVCVRQAILKKAGGFSEEPALVSMEDFDLWLRIAQITEEFAHIPRVLGAYWVWEGNVSKSPERFISTYPVIMNRYKDRLQPDDRKEAENFESYCISIRKLYQARYTEGRQLLYRSVRSKNADTMLKSLARIALSFPQQAISFFAR